MIEEAKDQARIKNEDFRELIKVKTVMQIISAHEMSKIPEFMSKNGCVINCSRLLPSRGYIEEERETIENNVELLISYGSAKSFSTKFRKLVNSLPPADISKESFPEFVPLIKDLEDQIRIMVDILNLD